VSPAEFIPEARNQCREPIAGQGPRLRSNAESNKNDFGGTGLSA
jgi:hypothetical protein